MKKQGIEDITKQLQQGVKDVFSSDRYKNYLDCMSKFYHYSASNCLLIAMQCPEASLIAGYKAWKTKFNRNVRKGEKAIKIIAPCPHKKTITDDAGNETEITFTTYRAACVFDVSQTEGQELPTMCNTLTGSVAGCVDLIRKLEAISPVPVRYESIKKANGYFNFVDKVIAIKENMPELQTVKTLVHEIVHAVLHNKETGEEKDAARNTKEVQAESVAYIVCSYLDLDTSEYSFEYVAGWSKDKEMKDLQDSMNVIQRTAKQIIDAIV